MDYGAFKRWVAEIPIFTTQDVVTISGQNPAIVAVSLTRWVRAGQVIRLRRGLYTLSDQERRAPLRAPIIAAALVEPSYLSGVWLLSNDSVVPEAVFMVTSATRGRSVEFENPYGRFAYQRLPERAWFGYGLREVDGQGVLFADPEKALLDTIYWSRSDWKPERFRQERVDGDRINRKRLERYVKRWGEPQLFKSLEAFMHYQQEACPTW